MMDGLKYLFEQTLNAMQTRWLEFLSEYDYVFNILERRRTRLLMQSNEEYMQRMLQPLVCAILI
jgi:hypothetical protein